MNTSQVLRPRLPNISTAQIVTALVILIACAVPMFIRPRIEASNLLTEARSLAQSSHLLEASSAYRKAISWRSPFNPYPAEAAHELRALAEKDGTPKATQLLLFEDLERGLCASRSWLWTIFDPINTPLGGITIEEIQGRIDRIAPPPPVQIRELYPPHVNIFFQVFAQLFFWTWIASVLYLIWSSFDSNGRVSSPLLPKISMCTGLFVSWLVALRFA